MAESFSIGEIAIYVRPTQGTITNSDGRLALGSEVTVTSALVRKKLMNLEGTPIAYVYVIETQDGRILGAPPECLRKRPPKQDWKTLCRLTDLPREVTHV